MGTLKHGIPDKPQYKGVIYGSPDGSKHFQEVLLPFDGGDAPSGVVKAQGRLWKAIPGGGDGMRSFASIDVDDGAPLWCSESQGRGLVFLDV